MQSRKHSMAEAVTNTAVGFLVALLTQLLVFPLFGIVVGATAHLSITAVFTAVSVVRSYLLRRFFTHRTEKPKPVLLLDVEKAYRNGFQHGCQVGAMFEKELPE